MKFLSDRRKTKCPKVDWIDKSLLKLFSGLFLVFLFVTVAFVIYVVVAPTPTEWGIVTGELQRSDSGSYAAVQNATSFPNNFSLENLTKAIFRHWAVFPEHINGKFLIAAINFAFITMFIRNIKKTIGEKLEKGEPIGIYVYVDWAIGSLISGILFYSSGIDIANLTTASLSIAIIVVFALVSYYVLYRLRNELEGKGKENEKET